MSEAAKPESEKRKFRAIRGVRDILPPESALWDRVEQTAREVFTTYGYREIILPVFEETELFARSVGLDTDIVSKEMYTFVPKVELMQRAFLESASGVDTPASLLKFLQYLAVFVDNLQRGMDAGEESNDPENIKILNDLNKLVAAAVERYNGGERDPNEDWNVFLEQARKSAEKVLIAAGESLRPEGTASVVRAYIEHGMHTLPGNVKLYYIGPMFRRERPQKGRYRQFYQIGAEVLGPSDAPAIDAELIEMLIVFFNRVGLTGTTLYINSIGCKECRPKYVELLRGALQKVKDQLGPDSQRRIDTNPLRVLDSKIPDEQPIIEKLPRITDHLCPKCRAHFGKLQEEVRLRNVAYEINWRLVRGLDYYTRTTFEVVAAGLGSQNAVCGGGRYDGLVELLGGPPTKGIGFAIGTDRVILSLQETGKASAPRTLDVFVAWMGANAYPAAVRIAQRLRTEGLAVEIPPEDMKFKKSIGLADKLGARYALIIGDDEVASGQFTVKCLADGEQKKLSETELLAHLRAAP